MLHNGQLSWDALVLVTAEQARAGDAYALGAGDSPDELMWRAAGQLARAVIAPRTSGYGMRVVIVAGKGNNGGDGYAAALRLVEGYGANVSMVAFDGCDVALSLEASRFRAQWIRANGRVITAVEDAMRAVARADVVIDAILGTGAKGPLRDTAVWGVRLLANAHQAGKTLIACDLPTGVDPDTGEVMRDTVPVARTVTFGAVKQGLLLSPGRDFCGELVVASLGELWDTYLRLLGEGHGTKPCVALGMKDAAPKPYGPTDDKWSRGRVAVIGGSPGTSGACVLSAKGALNAGAGLVSVYASTEVADEIAGSLDAAIMLKRCPKAQTAASGICGQAWLDSLDLCAHADVVVAGPGLGVSHDALNTVTWLLGTAQRLVLDADALNVFRDDPSVLADHVGQVVLTPHRKELARIGGGLDGEDAWRMRVSRVPKLARELAVTIVAKGPATLVAAPDGRLWVTPVGSPAAGTAGSGDLLAGMIAAAIARADDVSLAVAQAVWWHGYAAKLAAERTGGRATVATLIGALPWMFKALADRSRTL